jgi:glutathione S-transferase
MIPVLEDGGFTLYESRAIARYLDDVLPGPKLVPGDARARAAMEQWISVEQSYVSPPVGEIVQQKFVVPMRGGTIDLEVLDRARVAAGRALAIVDAALAGRSYLAGDDVTLADISLAPVIGMLAVAGEGELVERRPGLAAWWERVSARPSWKQATSSR